MSKEYATKLKYLSYSTIYRCTGDVNRELMSNVCFSSVLNCFDRNLKNEHYEIYIINDLKYLNQGYSNFCFLTLKELKKHIGLARRLFPFSYNIEKSLYKTYEAYKVIIDIDAQQIYHRYLLTWLRYAYEFPYNVILNDALRMKHEYLNKESITNLYILCANSYNSPELAYYGTGHAITYQNSCFLKEYELKEKIDKLAERDSKYGQLNKIYPTKNIGLQCINSEQKGCFLEYWINREDFDNRSKVYLHNYKLMKE